MPQNNNNRYELFFKKRYKVLHILNDFLIGLLFLVGSFYFFSEELKQAGIWMFVIGSFLLLIRPTIRLVQDFHYRKFVESRRSKCRE
ncbi:YrhK family protein [Bacillus haynesii]|uniref:YrhK family protein n=1 Tax=Bacillus haynesii TaxID=1925021 RepID=UPI00227E50CB|nr:YrhK family protein [Bacillus haynesii]MCY8004809.1 YrhK family protein [Bacillus haynesii]